MPECAVEATDFDASIIISVIERKALEIEKLKKALRRYSNAERIAQTENLIAYLEADIISFKTLLADFTGDTSYIEGVDLDSTPVIECPSNYTKYLEGLPEEDYVLEIEADQFRTEYCEGVLDDMYREIGNAALDSKKMIRLMLEDPYSVSVIGELIYNDDYLYDSFRAFVLAKNYKKSKKKRKRD